MKPFLNFLSVIPDLIKNVPKHSPAPKNRCICTIGQLYLFAQQHNKRNTILVPFSTGDYYRAVSQSHRIACTSLYCNQIAANTQYIRRASLCSLWDACKARSARRNWATRIRNCLRPSPISRLRNCNNALKALPRFVGIIVG